MGRASSEANVNVCKHAAHQVIHACHGHNSYNGDAFLPAIDKASGKKKLVRSLSSMIRGL